MSGEGVSMGQAEVLRESDMAILVRIDDKEFWVPKSQVHDNSEAFDLSNEGELIVTYWWAHENGHI